MVAKQSIDKLLESHMMLLKDKKGIIIDGYPREVNQVKDFEEKVFFTSWKYVWKENGFFLILFSLFLYTVPANATNNFIRLFKITIRPRSLR